MKLLLFFYLEENENKNRIKGGIRMKRNYVRKGIHELYQGQTMKKASSLLVLAALLTFMLGAAGCGSKENDAATLESGSITESESETESQREFESVTETETEEETEESGESGTEETSESETKKASSGNEKETTKSSSKAESSTKQVIQSANENSQSQQTQASQTTGTGNSPSGSTNSQKPASQPETKAPAATKAQVTLTGIHASYTGGTKTEGASVSAAEISVTASYSDGSSKAVSGWACNEANQPLPAGSHTFTVTYEGKSSSFTVNVEKAPAPTQAPTVAPTQAPTQAPTEAEPPATSQAYIDEFMRGFNQARSDYGMTPNIGVNAKWSTYAQYYAEYHAKKWHDNWEVEAEHSSLELDWEPDNEGIGYAYTAYEAGYEQAIHVGAYQHENFGDIGVGVYYYQGRYYVCVQTWEFAEMGVDSYPNI